MSLYSLQILLTTRIRNRLKLKYEPSMTVSGATSHTVHFNPFIRLDPEVVNYIPAQFSPDERYTQFFDVAKFQSLMRRQLQRGMQPKRTLEQAIKDGTVKNNIQVTLDTLLKGPLVVRGEEYAVFSKEWDGQFTQKDPALLPAIPPKPPAIPPKPLRPPAIPPKPTQALPKPSPAVPTKPPKPTQLPPTKPPKPTPSLTPTKTTPYIPVPVLPKNPRDSVVLRTPSVPPRPLQPIPKNPRDSVVLRTPSVPPRPQHPIPKNPRDSVVLRPPQDKERAETDPMTYEKALAILELEPNPSPEQIRKQLTRLLMSSQFENKDKLREAREFLDQWAATHVKPPRGMPTKTRRLPPLSQGSSMKTRRARDMVTDIRRVALKPPAADFDTSDDDESEFNTSGSDSDSDSDSDTSVESTYRPAKPMFKKPPIPPPGGRHKTTRALKSIAIKNATRRQRPTTRPVDSDTESSDDDSDSDSDFSSDSDTETNYRGGKRRGGAPIRYNAIDDKRRLTMRNRYGQNSRYGQISRYDREGGKPFYVTVKLELFPGKTVPLKWQAKLACQSQYERVRENYADMMGLQYLPNELYVPSSETYTKPETNPPTKAPIGVHRPYKNARFGQEWV